MSLRSWLLVGFPPKKSVGPPREKSVGPPRKMLVWLLASRASGSWSFWLLELLELLPSGGSGAPGFWSSNDDGG